MALKKVCFSAFGHLPRKISTRPNLHYFNVPKLHFLQKEEILNATLFVHLPRAPKNGDADVWIDTHKLTLNQVGNARRIGSNHVQLDHHFGGWVDIEVTRIVHQWLEDPSTNFGLEMKVWGSRPMEIIIPPKNPSEVLTFLKPDAFENILILTFSEFLHCFENQGFSYPRFSYIRTGVVNRDEKHRWYCAK